MCFFAAAFKCLAVSSIPENLKSLLESMTFCPPKSPLVTKSWAASFELIEQSFVLFGAIRQGIAISTEQVQSIKKVFERLPPNVPQILFHSNPQPQQDILEALATLLDVLTFDVGFCCNALYLSWRFDIGYAKYPLCWVLAPNQSGTTEVFSGRVVSESPLTVFYEEDGALEINVAAHRVDKNRRVGDAKRAPWAAVADDIICLKEAKSQKPHNPALKFSNVFELPYRGIIRVNPRCSESIAGVVAKTFSGCDVCVVAPSDVQGLTDSSPTVKMFRLLSTNVPQNLFVIIERGAVDAGGDKCFAPVKFEQTLNVPFYQKSRGMLKFHSFRRYTAIAFAEHLGMTAFSGHYVAHILRNDTWWCHNDERNPFRNPTLDLDQDPSLIVYSLMPDIFSSL